MFFINILEFELPIEPKYDYKKLPENVILQPIDIIFLHCSAGLRSISLTIPSFLRATPEQATNDGPENFSSQNRH